MKYRLVVSGTIEFKDGRDESIREMLFGDRKVPAMQRFGVAMQELEEGAEDLKVEMKLLEEVVTVCPRCQSKHHLTVVPDEEDDRFDDYICHNCDCHFRIDR